MALELSRTQVGIVHVFQASFGMHVRRHWRMRRRGMIMNAMATHLSLIWCSGNGLMRMRENSIESRADLGSRGS